MNERVLAYKILYQFQQSLNRIDKIESKILHNKQLFSNQNRHLRNLVSGVLRHQSLLDWYISKLYKGDFKKLIAQVKTILRMGMYEILYMEQIPDHAAVDEYVKIAKRVVNLNSSKLVNAVLRSFLRQKDDLLSEKERHLDKNISISYSFPGWLINRWIKYWGEPFTKELCASLNKVPVFNIRINRQKTSPEGFEKLLLEKGIQYIKSDDRKGCYQINKIRQIRQAGFFDLGLCSVQDESAMIPVALYKFNDDDTFLDVCSAPGGKFTQVLEENPNIRLAVAVDENVERLKRVKENLKRLGLTGSIVAADANQLPFKIKFSKILIDAPCSGQGVIGKHPDIKWRRSEKEIIEFSLLQKTILEKASKFLENNGSLVYSTCSVDKEENENVVDHFLGNKSSEYVIVQSIQAKSSRLQGSVSNGFIRTYPHLHNMDGSFACLIKKLNK